jgi:hemin uptake protein HemP
MTILHVHDPETGEIVGQACRPITSRELLDPYGYLTILHNGKEYRMLENNHGELVLVEMQKNRTSIP